MATKDLQKLRHQYKAAYTTYMGCVQALSDASEKGIWPSPEILGAEERALNELTLTRQALLDALYAHAKTRTSWSAAAMTSARDDGPGRDLGPQ
jgi:hypothetical protein